MDDWSFDSRNGQLICEVAGLTARVYSTERKIEEHLDLAPDLSLAPFFLWEWVEYRVRVEGAESPLRVFFGHELAKSDPDGYAKFCYQNQIGRSMVRIIIGGQLLPPLEIEVISKKLSLNEGDPLYYPAFYRALVDQIVEHSATLPFTFTAPTYHAVEESVEPPSPLFIFHFLKNNREQLQEALETILGNPHRLLGEEEDFVSLPRVREVDAGVVLSILGHPEYWARYDGHGLAVAERLKTPDGVRYAPTKVCQRLKVHTFDTAENRFVKWFVRELAFWTETISRAEPPWRNIVDEARQEFVEANGFLELALHDPLFDEVGEMVYFPSSSQVLLKRDGYRELLQLYRLFNLARHPFFRPLAEAIDSRDVAALYEYWCFFELVRRFEEMWGKAKISLEIGETGELQWGVAATFSDGRKLVYNEGFGRARGRSYSVSLRPDFVLHEDSRPTVVFDAKFRFDPKSLPAGEEEDTYERDVAGGDVERIVKRADIYKMHTYRDALRTVRAAVALFPGSEGAGEFYERRTSEKRSISLRDLIERQWEGVGAIPLLPGNHNNRPLMS